MNTKYSLNHFENKYVIPTRPNKTGNARFDNNICGTKTFQKIN